MSWLASLTLSVLHTVYWLVSVAKSLWCSYQDAPNALTAERKKMPAHLALLLVAAEGADPEETENVMIESTERAAAWCRSAGIPRLTIYDRQGVLAQASSEVRERLLKRFPGVPGDSSGSSDVEFPLTPPPSDDSESRPLSPAPARPPLKLHVATIHVLESCHGKKKTTGKAVLKRRRPSRKESDVSSLTVYVVSRQSGKPAIASAATQLLQTHSLESEGGAETYATLSEQQFSLILEGNTGLPSPDLMLVYHIHPRNTHKLPLELHGFPPWQMRVTEIFYDDHSACHAKWGRKAADVKCEGQPLEEKCFRRALDEYSGAEMRLGK